MLQYILLLSGLFLLIKSADYLIQGATAIGQRFKISPLVIGLTLVAFGTSLPELIVTIFASLRDTGDIIMGNIIGSNLANSLLALGILGVLIPVSMSSATVWKQIPFALLAALILLILSVTGGVTTIISLTDGLLLLLLFGVFLYYLYDIISRDNHFLIIDQPKKPLFQSFLMILLSILGLYVGGKFTVDSVVSIAQTWGWSEFLISATIISIGTSLPEIITSLVALRKKNLDVAVGNIIGSNVFNIFMVLGVAAVIRPVHVAPFLIFDLLFLVSISAVIFIFMFIGKHYTLTYKKGVFLLLMYTIYLIVIIMR